MNSSMKKSHKAKANSNYKLVEANKAIAALKAQLQDCQKRLSLAEDKMDEREGNDVASSSPESAIALDLEKEQPDTISAVIADDEFQENMASRLPYFPATEADEVAASVPEIEKPVIHQPIAEAPPPVKTEIPRDQKPSKVTRGVIKEVHLRQTNQVKQVLRADAPIFVYSRLNLPTAPTPENADIDVPTYGLRVVIRDTRSESRNWLKELAHDLVFGVTEYETMMELPCLDPGTYAMNFYAVVPFIHTADEKSLTFTIN